jgi:hypothetical protein
MGRGGYRQGAGRKRGASNILTAELREKISAGPLIQFLQELAGGKVDGATINERKDAAIALLRKILPDCRQTDVSLTEASLVIDAEHAEHIARAIQISRRR